MKKQFIPVFYIFKEGVTSEPVLIVRKEGEPFNMDFKVNKYLMMGFKVELVKPQKGIGTISKIK